MRLVRVGVAMVVVASCQGGSPAVEPPAPSVSATAVAAPTPTPTVASTSAPDDGALSVVALRAKAPAAGTTHRLRGYVVKQYRCPPCPPDAHCKPCMGNNVVLSDDPDRHEHYDLDERDVIVFLDDPEALVLGDVVTITVRVLDRQNSNRGIRDLEHAP